MRTLVSGILIITLVLGCSAKLFAHVALDYPQGGETFIQGQAVIIQWHIVAFHQQLNWDLYFSSDGGNNWQPIQLDIPVDSLSYTWIVPAVITSQGRIKIFQDNVEHDYLDVSGDFIIVPNTSPPFLDAPANDVVIECGMPSQETALQQWLDDHGGAAASNYCGTLIWTNDFDGLSNDCGITGSALVTFTATDSCGSTFTVASVTVEDTHPPTFFVLPADKIVECDGLGNQNAINSWLSSHGGAQASDACSTVVWTNDYSAVGDGCGASGSTQVTFKATDACGNFSTATAMFTISDHVAPLIVQGAHDTIMECNASNAQAIQTWLNHHAGARAEDICGNVSWTNNFSSLGDSCGGTGNAIVVFTVEDECGNSTTTAASVWIQDHTAPLISSVAQDTTIYCGTPNLTSVIQSWLNRQGGAQATDACGNVNWSNDLSSISDSCTNEVSVIKFFASDDCGNSSVTQAFLSVLDTATHQSDTTIFAPIGSTWYYVASSVGPPWVVDPLYFLFLTEKDTFMLGYNAREIGCYVNHDGQLERRNDLTKYVATVGQKVYYKVGNDFVLLYDFGAQAGDTIHSRVEHFDLSLGCSNPDSTIDFSYVIDSVITIQIDGENVKVQQVTSQTQFPGPNWGFWNSGPIHERIGYLGWGGLWWGTGLDGCIPEAGYLRCYIDDAITWHSSQFNEQYACDYLNVPEIGNGSPGFLYPNPTTGFISLPENAMNPSFFDFNGRPVRFTFSDHNLNVTGNPAGLYVVKFEIGAETYFSKIVLR